MAGKSRRDKVQEWTERLQRFEASSLSVDQFCQVEGVAQASYYRWKTKLRNHAAAPSPKNRFQNVRVSLGTASFGHRTTVQLGQGICIELGNDLLIADLVVNRVLDAVVHTDRNAAPSKAK